MIVNSGYDLICDSTSKTASRPAAADYMALTANTTAPAAGDTTLTGEIATASGGLIRKQVAYAHTAGTKVWTLSGTFTANGNDSLPVTIGKMATFNASSGGSMLSENLISPTAVVSAVGDALTVTDTFTLT